MGSTLALCGTHVCQAVTSRGIEYDEVQQGSCIAACMHLRRDSALSSPEGLAICAGLREASQPEGSPQHVQVPAGQQHHPSRGHPLRAGQRCPGFARPSDCACARAHAPTQTAPQSERTHAALCAQAEQRARSQQQAAAWRGLQRHTWLRPGHLNLNAGLVR